MANTDRNYTFSPQYSSRYTNNVQFEVGQLDFKLLFGETSPDKGVEIHTGITMTPAQAKILLHFLTINVAVYEAGVGPIIVPKELRPVVPAPPAEDAPNSAIMKTVFEKAKRSFDELMG